MRIYDFFFKILKKDFELFGPKMNILPMQIFSFWLEKRRFCVTALLSSHQTAMKHWISCFSTEKIVLVVLGLIPTNERQSSHTHFSDLREKIKKIANWSDLHRMTLSMASIQIKLELNPGIKHNNLHIY